MIQLQPFRLSPWMYYQIVAKKQLRRSWWIYLVCFCIAIYFLFLPQRSSLTVFMTVFGMAYLPIVLIYLYFWATSKKNDPFFQERQMTLENEKLTVRSAGMYSELHYKQILEVIETSDYLLLYIAQSQFVYVPKSAFADNDGVQVLRNRIKSARDNAF